MGGGASLEIAHIVTHSNTYDGRVLTRVSTFLFARPGLPDAKDIQVVTEANIVGATPGAVLPYRTGKIGIQLEVNQKVDDFFLLFEGFRYTAQRDQSVKSELTSTFEATPGGTPHLEWHGFSVSLPPPTDRFAMSALLKIDVKFKKVPGPGLDIYRGMYAVPMVFGFYPVPFADHYALGVTTLQPDSANKVDTSVRLRS